MSVAGVGIDRAIWSSSISQRTGLHASATDLVVCEREGGGRGKRERERGVGWGGVGGLGEPSRVFCPG